MMRTANFAMAVLLLGTAAFQAHAADITGAGSTFAYPIFAKWADTYKAKTNVGLNYQAIGSGAGIKQITAKTVDFGASDMPLKPNVLEEKGLTQFPAIMGGVVTAINLRGIKAGEIRLNGTVLADIYLGKIKHWDDPAIKALNPHVRLPHTGITVVRRSDGSGTTFIFTNYLSKVSHEWKEKVGCNTAVAWPEGVSGKGNAGVASYVQRINGSIGYVEYAYAKQAKMPYALMENRDGKFVKPEIKTFQAAAKYAKWSHDKDFYEVLTDEPGPTSWPITGATFVLLHKKTDNPKEIHQVMDFFNWSFKNGQAQAASLDYVPMPANVVKMIENSWKANVHDASGSSVWK